MVSRVRAVWRWITLAGLAAALVPLTLWAVPATHPSLQSTELWTDHGGDYVVQWIVRRGLDRHGYVHQERLLTWTAATPSALNEVRAHHPVDMRPADSRRFQLGEYGKDHVYLPHGVELVDGGVIRTLPYSLMAAALATPAMLRGLLTAWRTWGRRA